MNRNKNNIKNDEAQERNPYSKDKTKSKTKRNYRRGSRNSSEPTTRVEDPTGHLTHKNLGAWYYTDAEIMEQASRLSFQGIVGTSFPEVGAGRVIPTTRLIYFNPSPGVTPVTNASAPYEFNYSKSGVNMAAFKLFTQLSMSSGRTATYAPQDIITLILQVGELISMTEWARRLFGIAFTYNQRNRVWPKDIIDMLGIYSDDFFANLANYRMQMNTAITRIKQIPIPENIGYFHKCEMLYQHAFTDSTSPLAQVTMFQPATTWILDETYAEGTALRTIDVTLDHESATGVNHVKRNFSTWMQSVYLPMIDALLSSSTLNVIYADILNMTAKNGAKMWEFDYISEAYSITPEYNIPMNEIIHNIVPVGCQPVLGNAGGFDRSTSYVTNYNDVYPDAANNALIYNPKFVDCINGKATGDTISSNILENTIVDLADPNADLDTRLDIMEYKAIPYSVLTYPGDSAQNLSFRLPDHYAICAHVYGFYDKVRPGNYIIEEGYYWSYRVAGDTTAPVRCTGVVNPFFDWGPVQVDLVKNSANQWFFRDIAYSDVNYFTKVDSEYMERLLTLSYLGLFTLRFSQK